MATAAANAALPFSLAGHLLLVRTIPTFFARSSGAFLSLSLQIAIHPLGVCNGHLNVFIDSQKLSGMKDGNHKTDASDRCWENAVSFWTGRPVSFEFHEQ